MKKLLLVLVIAIIPAMAFAQFQVGGTALYTAGDLTQASGPVSASDFSFGAESRLKLWLFQVGGTVYYVPGDSSSTTSLLATADAGLSLDLWILRIGAGLGVNAVYADGEWFMGPTQLDKPYNLKATADINLGGLSLGVEGIYFLTDFQDISAALQAAPAIGFTVMIKLF